MTTQNWKTLMATFMVAGSLVATATAKTADTRAVPPLARSKVFHHVRHHQGFPVTRNELLLTLERSTELTAAENAWIGPRLAHRVYRSGADVVRTLFPDVPHEVLDRIQPGAEGGR